MRTKVILFLAVLLCAAGQAIGQNLTREQYINKYKDIAVGQMRKYKIPASITMAQACLESDNGNSALARKANNHFGIKCHNGWKGKGYKHDDDARGECFRRYKNAEDSYIDHSYFLISGSRYNSLFDLKITDYKAWAHGLKAAGYATNPRYAQLLIDIIEEYRLYELDAQDAYKRAKEEEKIAKKLEKLERKAAKAEAKSRKANEKLRKFREKYNIADAAAIVENLQNFEEPPRKIAQPEQKEVRQFYTIKIGDTLYSIARKNNTSVEELYKLNPGINAQALKPGSRIRIK